MRTHIFCSIQEWIDAKDEEDVVHEYVWNRNLLMDVDTSNVDYLLGRCLIVLCLILLNLITNIICNMLKSMLLVF